MIGSMNLHHVVSISHTHKLVTDVTPDPYVLHRFEIQTKDGSRFEFALFTNNLNLALESKAEPPAPIPKREVIYPPQTESAL